ASYTYYCPDKWSGNFRHNGGSGGVTLFEISVKANDNNVYYDLSVIDGFIVPMKLIAPDGTRLGALHSEAPDAYLFPTDDTKTHGGPAGDFTIIFEGNSASPGTVNTIITSKVIALRSNANGKFVCATNAGNSPLVANRDCASGWETFDLIILNRNNVALKSHANGQYVCAENGGNSPLIANRASISSWETFQMIDRGNGKVAFIAVNGNYVCADNFGNSALIANRNSVDSWETFDLVPQ
ncbi:unnamed protein product, partial [Rotaria sordida]